MRNKNRELKRYSIDTTVTKTTLPIIAFAVIMAVVALVPSSLSAGAKLVSTIRPDKATAVQTQPRAELPQRWRMSNRTVSFDHMYRSQPQR